MLKGIHKYLLIYFGVVFIAPNANAVRIMNNNPIKEDWGCKVVDGDWQCARSEKPKNVFNPKLSEKTREKALADDMSWVPKQEYFVGGYYNNDESFTKQLCKTDKTNLSYENAEYDTDGTLVASGNVEVLQCNQELYSDNSIVNFSPDGSSIQSMVMTGDVVAKQPSTGILLRTEELDVNITDGTYSAGKSFFRLAHESPPTRMYDKEHFSGHLRGYGDTFKETADGNIFLENGYITSGDPYDDDWKMTGRNIDIDTEEGMAYLTDAQLKVKDVPVFYFPYFSQPVDDRRRSGFLYPGINQVGDTDVQLVGGGTEKRKGGGLGLSLPYYFNLGKNYDLLTETVIWSNRGLMENGDFRYKTNYFEGEIAGSVMLDTLEKKLRGAFTISNQGDFNNGIKTNFQYDYVSDKNYYNDFSVGDIGLVTKTLLDREFDVTYESENINAGLTILSYGLVNDDMNLGNIPYAKLPELTFSANSSGYTPDYLDLSIDTVNTYFSKAPHPITPLTSTAVGTNVNAFRAYEAPKVQVNYENLWGYINPSIEVPLRYYQLQNKPTDIVKFQKNSVTSIIPIFNIDSAMNFDRDYATSEGSYTQTLTPRLFYTYIPYQDQSDIPLFDTSQQNDQYMQMFQVNKFTGHDRINNANQITYAMESTTMSNDDGTTLSSLKIGQMFYMADRRVTLQQGNSPAAPNIGSTDNFSPIMSSFEYQILKSVYFQGQVNYSVQNKNVDYQIYGLQYKDESENIFNVAYNNIANNWNSMTQDQINNGDTPVAQETVTVSSMLNITDHWGIAALWNYNFEQKQTANVFVGLQYNDKSWALRGLVQATSYTNQNSNCPTCLSNLTYSYMLELELKGLGGVGDGAQIVSQLQQITGYEAGEWGEGS